MFVRMLTGIAGGALLAAAALGSPWGVPGPSFWMLDLAFSASLLFYAISPTRALHLIPSEATFDWAGARGQGIPAPRGASFKYPFRLAVFAFLYALFVVRGFYAAAAILSQSPTLEPPITAWLVLPATLLGAFACMRALYALARKRKSAA